MQLKDLLRPDQLRLLSQYSETGGVFLPASLEVGNVAANKLVITYGDQMNTSITPANGDFAVNDGAANAVTGVAIAGAVVTLTLTNNVDNGDTVICSYTSGANALQNANGNEAEDFSSSSVTNNVAAPVYEAEYQAVYNEFGTTPSVADASAQNTFVKSLVDNGIWTELDRLFIFASHAMGADALLDWVNPTGTSATLVNAPTGTQYQGYVSDGSTSLINSNYDPSSDATNWKQNVDVTASCGVYCRTDQLGVGFKSDIGGISGGDTQFAINDGSNGFWASIVSNTGKSSAALPDTQGFYSADAENAGASTFDLKLYKDGSFLTSNTGLAVDPTLEDIGILARINSGTPALFTTRQLSMAYFGGELGATKQLAFYNAFQTLMTYYGTQV
jgi:uncharacterized repeat protein (TIGR02059 family)